MSEISAAIESLAARHSVPVLELLEFFNERAAIRQYEAGTTREAAEQAAIGDAELWAKLHCIVTRGQDGNG